MGAPRFSWMWGDPAAVAERMEQNKLGCSLCGKADENWGKMHCMDVRNHEQKGVPTIGHRCKWFVEKGEKNA